MSGRCALSDTNGRLRDFLARGRTRHASLCIDTGTAVRVTGSSLNTTTSAITETTTTVYTGPCRLKREQMTEDVAGESEAPTARLVLVLPWSTTGANALRQGDRFTFTASEDTALVGSTVTVIGPDRGTTKSAFRYLVEEVTA